MAVVAVGAVHLRALQSQVVRDYGDKVTAMVLVEPTFEVQVSKVVVILSVTVISLSMGEPYWSGSMVKVIVPSVLDGLITAQLLIGEPSVSSAIA